MKTLVMMAALIFALGARGEMCNQLPSPLEFQGQFGPVSATALECQHLFGAKEYDTQHFRMGPTGRTSVLHFRSGLPAAFLNEVNMVGLLGPDCDIAADKKMVLSGTEYLLHSEGIVGEDVLLVTVSIEVRRNGQSICKGSAEYTGLPRGT